MMTDGITGASYKVMPAADRHGFMLGLNGLVTSVQNQGGNLADPDNMARTEQSLYLRPELREQLYQRLGGEFWFGTLSQPGAFSTAHSTLHRALGLQVILPVGHRWAIQAGVSRGAHTATATFPVTVLGHQNGLTKQDEGTLRAEITGLHIHVAGRFYLAGSGLVRPFTGIGLEYGQYKGRNIEAGLAGVSWAFEAPLNKTQWQLSLPLGLSLQPRAWPVFAEIGGGALWSFQGEIGWSAQMTVGGKF